MSNSGGGGSGSGLPSHPAVRGAPNIFQRLALGKPKSSRRSSSSSSSSSSSAPTSYTNGGSGTRSATAAAASVTADVTASSSSSQSPPPPPPPQQQQQSSNARGPWQGIGSDDRPLPPLPPPPPVLVTTTSSFVSTASSTTTSGLSMGGSAVALPGHLKMKTHSGTTTRLQHSGRSSSIGVSGSSGGGTGDGGDPSPSRRRSAHQEALQGAGGTVSRLLQHTQAQLLQQQQQQMQSPRVADEPPPPAPAVVVDGASIGGREGLPSSSLSSSSLAPGREEVEQSGGRSAGQSQLAASVLNIDLTAADEEGAVAAAAAPGGRGGSGRRRRGIGEMAQAAIRGNLNQFSPPHRKQQQHGPAQQEQAQQQQQQLQLTYTERKFEELMAAEVVNLAKLRELSWGGVPDKHRGTVWRLLLGYLPAHRDRRPATLQRKRGEYAGILPQYFSISSEERTLQEQEILRQILVDIPRTQPDVPLFHQEEIQRCMERVLYVWAIRHPASGYVQGMNDLITPFILVFLAERLLLSPSSSPPRAATGPGAGRRTAATEAQTLDASKVPPDVLAEVEADVYWCLTKLLDNIQDHYTFSQPGLQRMIFRLAALVERHDPSLHRHLEEEGLQYVQFAFRWMNCLLMRELSLDAVIRVWDTELAEEAGGFEAFHVYLCAAVLLRFADALRTLPFQELVLFLQDLPTHDWTLSEIEPLLAQAHVLRTLYPDFGATSAARQIGLLR